jgi:hypothetical protein
VLFRSTLFEQPFHSHFEGHCSAGASVARTAEFHFDDAVGRHINQIDIPPVGLEIRPDFIDDFLNLFFHGGPLSLLLVFYY